jgi:hypothetical protein
MPVTLPMLTPTLVLQRGVFNCIERLKLWDGDEQSSVVSVYNRVCQWIRDLESEIFLLGVTPFN